jgi:hypothetical protein
MATEQLALLEELSGSDLYSSAILGTYQFDGEFFEDEVLPILNQLDIANIVVLTDTQAYTEASDLTQAGQAYYLDHVRCSGIHHPKFVALLGHDHGRAFVGSGNLTEQGWSRNGELMTVVDYTADSGETGPVFTQLREFIEHSADQIHGSRATAAIDEAFRDAPWLSESIQSNSDELGLLHNYTEPLLQQVLSHVGDQPVESIEICSPFFSGTDDAVLEGLCELAPEELVINIQPDMVEGFDAGHLNAACFDGIDVTVNKIALTGDDSDRYLHAKLLLLKGPAGAWAFYGSPNLTTPALLKTEANGNIELGMLRHESDPEYFDYLLGSETVTRESISPDSVKFRPTNSTETSIKKPDFYLTDAYLESDGTLVVDHGEAMPPWATVHIGQSSTEKGFDLELTELADGSIRCQDERIPQVCQQSAQVRLTLQFEDETLESDARWIALPTLEQTPRPSEVQTVETSDGRDGLLEVLDRLPTWGLICKFLEDVDFRSMAVEGSGGRRVVKSTGADGEGGLEEWDPKDRDEILEGKTSTLLERIKTTRQELVLQETDPELFESFVNQYIALSKLVLWWDSQDSGELTHLADIRAATEILGEFIRSLSGHAEKKGGQTLEKEHALFEHAAIIMCYVNELQQRAGYDAGPNEHVYSAFQNTNREVLMAFGDLRGQAVPTVERLEDCIDEYSAIDGVSVGARRVEFYCKDLVDAE